MAILEWVPPPEARAAEHRRIAKGHADGVDLLNVDPGDYDRRKPRHLSKKAKANMVANGRLALAGRTSEERSAAHGKWWESLSEDEQTQRMAALSLKGHAAQAVIRETVPERWAQILKARIDGRKRGTAPPSPPTHCSAGHELSPENTFVGRKGDLFCRTCDELRRLAILASLPSRQLPLPLQFGGTKYVSHKDKRAVYNARDQERYASDPAYAEGRRETSRQRRATRRDEINARRRERRAERIRDEPGYAERLTTENRQWRENRKALVQRANRAA